MDALTTNGGPGPFQLKKRRGDVHRNLDRQLQGEPVSLLSQEVDLNTPREGPEDLIV